MEKVSPSKKTKPTTPAFCGIKVGNVRKHVPTKDPKTGKYKNLPVFYSYKDVFFDMDGWADVNKFLPDDFDLVFMKLKRNRVIPGWINRQTWEGLRLQPGDEVLFWKRKEEVEEK